MSNIASIIGLSTSRIRPVQIHPMIVGTGRVGVELELENLTNVSAPSGWDVTIDGSLRNNGYEFVLRGAQGGTELFNSITSLEQELFDKNFHANLRCSTHVHLDVRELTIVQLKKLLLAYIVFEDLFFELSGSFRKSNNFCPSFAFAQEKIKLWNSLWSDDTPRFLDLMCNHRDRRTDDKYSSLNVVPVHHLGSIEFRGSEPKPSAGQMIRLVNRMLGLYQMVIDSPQDLSYADFIQYLVRDGLPIELQLTLPFEIGGIDVDASIQKGVVLAYDVITQ